MKVDTLIFDFDDTLVDTYHLFLDYYDRFVDAMLALGFSPRKEILDYVHAADIASVQRIGHPATESFPLALRDTYRHFCESAGQPFQPEISAKLEALGWAVHEEPAALVEDAEPVLRELTGKVRLLLLSQGDEENQLRRIYRSGLQQYFEACIVVPLKTTEVYQQVAATYQLTPKRTCMIGNSMRSDINPALQAGFQGIHIQLNAWAYDDEDAYGAHDTVSRLAEVLRIIQL